MTTRTVTATIQVEREVRQDVYETMDVEIVATVTSYQGCAYGPPENCVETSYDVEIESARDEADRPIELTEAEETKAYAAIETADDGD